MKNIKLLFIDSIEQKGSDPATFAGSSGTLLASGKLLEIPCRQTCLWESRGMLAC